MGCKGSRVRIPPPRPIKSRACDENRRPFFFGSPLTGTAAGTFRRGCVPAAVKCFEDGGQGERRRDRTLAGMLVAMVCRRPVAAVIVRQCREVFPLACSRQRRRSPAGAAALRRIRTGRLRTRDRIAAASLRQVRAPRMGSALAPRACRSTGGPQALDVERMARASRRVLSTTAATAARLTRSRQARRSHCG